ncbi:MAG: YraN family protein [Fretibacterium sp.]|nr:YraN family protein [Fretibacterium sp.]
MSRHLELGRLAEDRAAAYVASLGWKLLGRNLTNAFGELDIAALDRSTGELVVVEVRCRTLGNVQSPSDSIGPQKLRTLVKAGRAFVEARGWTGPWRIDLIGFTVRSDAGEDEAIWELEHLRDITGGDYPS